MQRKTNDEYSVNETGYFLILVPFYTLYADRAMREHSSVCVRWKTEIEDRSSWNDDKKDV